MKKESTFLRSVEKFTCKDVSRTWKAFTLDTRSLSLISWSIFERQSADKITYKFLSKIKHYTRAILRIINKRNLGVKRRFRSRKSTKKAYRKMSMRKTLSSSSKKLSKSIRT